MTSAATRRGYWRPAAFWAGFIALVAASWLALLVMTLQPIPQAGIVAFLLSLCATASGLPGYLALASMWGLMTLAMMGPVAIPYLTAYASLGQAGGHQPPSIHLWCLAAGYLSVWAAYALAAAGLQFALVAGASLDADGRLVPAAAAVLLAVAAMYQISPLKTACLVRCQSPFSYFLASWRPGALGAAAMGARQGAVCAACCWALMLLAFVAGVMNVAWMAGVTALMLLERMEDPYGTLRRFMAALLAAGALAGLLRALEVL